MLSFSYDQPETKTSLELSEVATIEWVEMTIEFIRKLTGVDYEISDLTEAISKNKGSFLFLDKSLNITTSEDPLAQYCLVDTGIMKDSDNEIYISLLPKTGGLFSGYRTGVLDFLLNSAYEFRLKNGEDQTELLCNMKKVKELASKIRVLRAEGKQDEIDPLIASETKKPDTKVLNRNGITTVVNRSIDPDLASVISVVNSLLMINKFKTIYGLERYIKIIGDRAKILIQEGKSEYYILNNIKSCVINTGLLDRFGNDIQVIYRINMKDESYRAFKVVGSKTDLVDNGFDTNDISRNIKPISFLTDERVFTGEVSDFDINYHSLFHILDDRRDRFPVELATLSDNIIASRINESIESGIKINKRDNTYIKPIYSTESHCISWVFPLHLSTSLVDNPELALIVRKEEQFYEVKTILPYGDELVDRMRCLALYS